MSDDERNRNQRVEFHMMQVQILQPSRKKMKDEEKISGHEHGVESQLDKKRSQRPGNFSFHRKLRRALHTVRR